MCKIKRSWIVYIFRRYSPNHSHHSHHHHDSHPNPQISLLVPFRIGNTSPQRRVVWEWLQRYWAEELPDAEIVIGHCRGKAFSKTEAVNNAAHRARGRVFVILDADTYIRGSVVKHCADTIEESLSRGVSLWFIPYRRLYRLTFEATAKVLDSDPGYPLRFSTPPPDNVVSSTLGSMHGHRFGAMIQIMPREAFELVGGMDLRFQGWGGEDIAFVRALDTLYIHHKTTFNDVLHLWHENIGKDFTTRMWPGQKSPRANENLANRYNKATGDRERMWALVNEGIALRVEPKLSKKIKWWLLLGLLLMSVVMIVGRRDKI